MRGRINSSHCIINLLTSRDYLLSPVNGFINCAGILLGGFLCILPARPTTFFSKGFWLDLYMQENCSTPDSIKRFEFHPWALGPGYYRCMNVIKTFHIGSFPCAAVICLRHSTYLLRRGVPCLVTRLRPGRGGQEWQAGRARWPCQQMQARNVRSAARWAPGPRHPGQRYHSQPGSSLPDHVPSAKICSENSSLR